MKPQFDPTYYKIIITRHGAAEKTEFVPTFAEGLTRVAALCKCRNVKGVPFLSCVTKTDMDMQARYSLNPA